VSFYARKRYNFMAGMLLLVMEEEPAFWTFLAVLRRLLPTVVRAC
jgi:hypothetical protein